MDPSEPPLVSTLKVGAFGVLFPKNVVVCGVAAGLVLADAAMGAAGGAA